MQSTSIEWTERTWNPNSGCERITEGCKFCYAHTIAENKRGTSAFPNGFDLTLRPHKLDEPKKLKQPSLIFVNSMSDLFWDQIPNSYRDKIVDVIADTPQHQYQVLTKRPELMLKYSRRRQLPPNFWAGVTIESGRLFEGRIQLLRQVDVPIRFLSAEPLLSPYPDKLDLSGVHWVITGGESGTHLYDRQLRERRALVDYADNKWTPRPSRVEWVRQIRDACQCQGVAFFHKQWGGARPKSAGSKLDGRKWHEYPQFDTTAA